MLLRYVVGQVDSACTNLREREELRLPWSLSRRQRKTYSVVVWRMRGSIIDQSIDGLVRLLQSERDNLAKRAGEVCWLWISTHLDRIKDKSIIRRSAEVKHKKSSSSLTLGMRSSSDDFMIP